jgi:TonB family protein
MTAAFSPLRFGRYLLVAELGRDAMGSVYRALRLTGERDFARVRVFESPEISEDSVLDTIEANGEIHSFLKNPAIARGVQMDAVDGAPYLAWNEPTGRTLDVILARARVTRQAIPIEHALLIAEKVAMALDHAYNTMLDGERTLHGLVWPGFVSISDDGEARLTGFGLAAGFFPSLSRDRFAREVAPYLAQEEREGRGVARNSDVYSVGALLFEMLAGRLPDPSDRLGDLRNTTPPIPSDVAGVLRMCLGEPDSRFQSAGELRRELGKLLFSGPYSPSTFNLAYFLSGLFAAEMEAENRARAREILLDPGERVQVATDSEAPSERRSAGTAEGGARTPRGVPRFAAIGVSLLVVAGIAGTVLLINRRPARLAPAKSAVVRAKRVPATTPTSVPALPTSGPTNAMTESQFREEVSRRVAQELKKLEQETRRQRAAAKPAAVEASGRAVPAANPAPLSPRSAAPSKSVEVAEAVPTEPPSRPTIAAPQTQPVAEAPAVEETPPKMRRVVKPVYPPAALISRIRGIVILRVLVSETGEPLEIEVVRPVRAGLTEAAVSAVRRWTFEPGRRDGVPVKAWTTVPIPFEP